VEVLRPVEIPVVEVEVLLREVIPVAEVAHRPVEAVVEVTPRPVAVVVVTRLPRPLLRTTPMVPLLLLRTARLLRRLRMRTDGKRSAWVTAKVRTVNAVEWRAINRNVRKSIAGMKGISERVYRAIKKEQSAAKVRAKT